MDQASQADRLSVDLEVLRNGIASVGRASVDQFRTGWWTVVAGFWKIATAAAMIDT